MKYHKRSITLTAGVLCALLGAVMIIKGNMWGILVFLLGFSLVVVHSALMMRTGGYDPMESIFNGWGKGRQTSMADKMDYPPDNPNANIWNQMEKKK